ncbi:MAG: type II toxin-antitoxin system HicB family antitoxin [Dehalococcoidales bacterium]|nr:type II toxin-antitoxin system HicB family antitoxin [Dehalococcoidales bacterium]
MSTRRFKVLVEFSPAEGVWVTYVPSLNHLSTFGQTREEALEETKEAILGYLEAAEKEGLPLPSPDAEPEVVDLEVRVA